MRFRWTFAHLRSPVTTVLTASAEKSPGFSSLRASAASMYWSPGVKFRFYRRGRQNPCFWHLFGPGAGRGGKWPYASFEGVNATPASPCMKRPPVMSRGRCRQTGRRPLRGVTGCLFLEGRVRFENELTAFLLRVLVRDRPEE